MISILVAYDHKNGIGADNDLLWQRDMPADLRRFKELTTGNAVIMGWKTYESIGRPLPNRQNIVMSRSARDTAEGVEIVGSLEEAYAAVEPGRETFVIGGGQVYAQALDSADRVLATEVDAVFDEATVFFPVLDMTIWKEAAREHHDADERNKYPYDYVTYERK
jgi:dihydrofolate reductase